MSNSSDDSLLVAEGVEKHFTVEQGFLDRLFGADEVVHAVDGVSLSVETEETLGVVGESGCGKSTLGRTLARLYDPTAGTIRFDGEDVAKFSGDRLKQLRKEVQVIFQDPLSSLNPRKTAGEIVGKPLSVHDIATGEDRDERVRELFEEVGLSPDTRHRYPHEFSGGQRQRIGIARALAVEPRLIIADEPVSALDVSVQAQIINLMKRLQEEYHLSYVFIAHDLSVVKHVSDRVAVMYLGEIVEEGPTDAIFDSPKHPYTRSLLHAIPSVEGDVGKREILLEGNPPSPIDPPSGCRFHTRCPEYIGDECTGETPALAGVADDQTVADGVNDVDGDAADGGEHRAACHWIGRDSDERAVQSPFEADGEVAGRTSDSELTGDD
ncbi:MAG: ABC transporter ATP-binding protein [Halolamina sp.]